MSANFPRPLSLNGELNIYTASLWRDRLLAEIGDCDDIELDLAAVSEIDASGVQLLLAARRHCQMQGRRCELGPLSAPVREALEFCRLLPLPPR
ncbi:MAG: hypothetical protein RIR00_2091 [Pseudomonadota bacterium]|jgi:anti-anti-sigma factor